MRLNTTGIAARMMLSLDKKKQSAKNSSTVVR